MALQVIRVHVKVREAPGVDGLDALWPWEGEM